MSDGLGDYLRQINHPVLSAEDEQLLAKRINGDDPVDAEAAAQELVRHNLRLVVSVAKRLARPLRMDLDDAIAYGNVGLVKAARNFQPRGIKFSTFATTAIQRAIQEAAAYASDDQPVPHRLSRGNGARYDDRNYERAQLFTTASSLDAQLFPTHDESRTSVGDSVPDTNADDPATLHDRSDHHADFYRLIALRCTEEQINAFVTWYVDGDHSSRRLYDLAYEVRCVIASDEAFRDLAAEMLGPLGVPLAS